MTADFLMLSALLAGWLYVLRPRLTLRQIWYRYFYLYSKHWRETRVRKLKDVGYKCEKCQQRGRLDVHHLTYARIGREKMSDLQVLCRPCHEKEHKKYDTRRKKSSD